MKKIFGGLFVLVLIGFMMFLKKNNIENNVHIEPKGNDNIIHFSGLFEKEKFPSFTLWEEKTSIFKGVYQGVLNLTNEMGDELAIEFFLQGNKVEKMFKGEMSLKIYGDDDLVWGRLEGKGDLSSEIRTVIGDIPNIIFKENDHEESQSVIHLFAFNLSGNELHGNYYSSLKNNGVLKKTGTIVLKRRKS